MSANHVRMSSEKRTRRRRQVLARDGSACRECGATDSPTIDHIVPLAQGGTSDLGNLQVLCRRCNHRKADGQVDSRWLPLKAYRDSAQRIRGGA